MTDLDDRLTEEEAARLWQRAAQLQTRALERTEAADRDQRGADDDDEQAGYALVHVREAAIEAGISPEYLDAALADMRAERAIRAERRGGGLARRFLSDPPDVITVSRLVSAPPRAVLAAMERVFARDAYQLSLTDRRGDPLDGGLLTFKIEGASFVSTDGFKGEASAADLREVLVTLRASADAPNETELTLRGPVAWAHRLNAGVGGVVVGMCGVTGGGIGWAASGALAGALLGSAVVSIPVAAALAAAVTVGSAVGSSALALVGFRGLYGYSIGKGRQGLESLLSVVAVEAQGGWGLGSDAAPGLDDATKELEPGDRPAIGPGAAPDEDPT